MMGLLSAGASWETFGVASEVSQGRDWLYFPNSIASTVQAAQIAKKEMINITV